MRLMELEFQFNKQLAEEQAKVIQAKEPISAESHIIRMNFTGLTIMIKTFFTKFEEFWQVRNSFCPKTANFYKRKIPERILCKNPRSSKMVVPWRGKWETIDQV